MVGIKSKKEYDEMIEFLEIVDLKIKIDGIISNLKKELLVDYDLYDEEIIFICDRIKKSVENKEFRVCHVNNEYVIGEDCGNCIAYDNCCDFIKGGGNEF